MSKELTSIIIFSLILLGGGIKMLLYYLNPYVEEIKKTVKIYTTNGFEKDYSKEIQTIKRTYKNGKVKIITKHIRY